eukprot:5450401-Pyramimonas_sp.AAC.1
MKRKAWPTLSSSEGSGAVVEGPRGIRSAVVRGLHEVSQIPERGRTIPRRWRPQPPRSDRRRAARRAPPR